jgi:NADH-quinone oxidoreductase subunit L
LAALSAVGGFLGMPEIISEHHFLKNYLSERLTTASGIISAHPTRLFEYSVLGASILVLALVWIYARQRFVSKKQIPPMNESEFDGTTKLLYNKYYVDEIYQAVIVKPVAYLSSLLYRVVDIKLLDGLVNSSGKITSEGSNVLRKLQTGSTGFYIFAMVLSIVAILVINLFIL